MSSKLKDTFLQLVRLGIGTSKNAKISNDIDWAALKTLADKQGLSAVVLDGLNYIPISSLDECGMPQMMRLEWIGEVLQNYEQRYEMYSRTIAEMAAWHQKHGYKMMVLKGYACSLDWPKPQSFLQRFFWRYRHWHVNAWKHELCFKESMWSSFWSGVWGHLLKPASI